MPTADERSPLLRKKSYYSGLESASSTGNVETGSSSDGVARLAKDGHPDMANKMHLLLPAVGIGIYLVAIDQLLAVAMYSRIGSELNALNSTSWVATSYFLTLTSFQPLYGKLSDIFGRKECLLFAYAVFGIGCCGCGLARNMKELCLARAVSGIGGGGMNSVVAILMSDIVPLRDRGIWQGYLNVIFAAGTSTGAPLGGLWADSLGWRWSDTPFLESHDASADSTSRSFLAQTPLCVIAWIAVYYVLDVPPTSRKNWLAKVKQIDFLGAFVLILAVVALLVGLDSGSNLGWSHVVTIVSLALSIPCFVVFVFIENKVAAHPFAPGRIIFHRNLFACYLSNFFGSAGYFGAVFFLPLYIQAVEGYGATMSGVLLVPAMICNVIASLLGGWVIKRTGRFYWVTVGGFGVLLFSMLPLMLSTWLKSLPGALLGLVLNAGGSGCGITTTLVGLLANAAVEDSAVVVASSYLFRSLGASIGISTSSAVMQHVLRSQLLSRLPSGEEARWIERRVRESLDIIKQLPPREADMVRSSYQVATLGAFTPTLVFLTVCFVVTFWVKEAPLKK
ncbi:MFS multidrug transporter [Ophiocordyceps camponoti-floridani]|uniref:MFS multidrug transporter n=1 Tax=Ophiocordyceps camponoti-floridani TaxID=2030778 RepID=A0A8H4VB88_9HYPO|nr:MFS multidrug transporter [Ophiocordyceps camponoti-floridani]